MLRRSETSVGVRRYGTLLLLAVGLLLAACGGTDAAGTTTTALPPTTTPEAPTTTAAPPTTTAAPAATTTQAGVTTTLPPPVEVVATDYAFEGIPETVPVGTSFILINDSTTEYHAIAIIKLSALDLRTLDEFAALVPDEIFNSEAQLLFGSPQAILGARPGETTSFTWNSASLYTPGRYLLIDTIPVGADPLETEAELTSLNTVSQYEGVDAHYQRGMIALVTVEE